MKYTYKNLVIDGSVIVVMTAVTAITIMRMKKKFKKQIALRDADIEASQKKISEALDKQVEYEQTIAKMKDEQAMYARVNKAIEKRNKKIKKAEELNKKPIVNMRMNDHIKDDGTVDITRIEDEGNQPIKTVKLFERKDLINIPIRKDEKTFITPPSMIQYMVDHRIKEMQYDGKLSDKQMLDHYIKYNLIDFRTEDQDDIEAEVDEYDFESMGGFDLSYANIDDVVSNIEALYDIPMGVPLNDMDMNVFDQMTHFRKIFFGEDHKYGNEFTAADFIIYWANKFADDMSGNKTTWAYYMLSNLGIFECSSRDDVVEVFEQVTTHSFYTEDDCFGAFGIMPGSIGYGKAAPLGEHIIEYQTAVEDLTRISGRGVTDDE